MGTQLFMAGIHDEEDISLRTRRIEILSELAKCIDVHNQRYFRINPHHYHGDRQRYSRLVSIIGSDPLRIEYYLGGQHTHRPDIEQISRDFPWIFKYFGYNPGEELGRRFNTFTFTAFITENLYLLLNERVNVKVLEELRIVLIQAVYRINQLPNYETPNVPFFGLRDKQNEYIRNFYSQFDEIMLEIMKLPIVQQRITNPPKATRSDADKIFETFLQNSLSKRYDIPPPPQPTTTAGSYPYESLYDLKTMKLSYIECYLTMLNQLIEVQHQERSESHLNLFWRENMDGEEKRQEAQRQSERTRNNAELFRKQRKERKQSRRKQRKEKKAMGLENVNAGVSPNLLPENSSANNPKGQNTIEKRNVPYMVNPNSGNNINKQKTNQKNRERKASKEQLIKVQKAEADISQERASRIGELIRSQSASRAERNSRLAAYAKLTENARLANQGTSLNGPIVNTRPPSRSRPKPKPRRLTRSYRLTNAKK